VAAGNAWFTLIGFMGMYVIPGDSVVFLIYREIELGPETQRASAEKTMLPCWRRTEEGAMGTIWFWLVPL